MFVLYFAKPFGDRQLKFLLCFILNLRAISKYKPQGAYIWRGLLSEFHDIRWLYSFTSFLFIEPIISVQSSSLSSSWSSSTLFMESSCSSFQTQSTTIAKPSSTASVANVKKAKSTLMPIGLLWSYFFFRWCW